MEPLMLSVWKHASEPNSPFDRLRVSGVTLPPRKLPPSDSWRSLPSWICSQAFADLRDCCSYARGAGRSPEKEEWHLSLSGRRTPH